MEYLTPDDFEIAKENGISYNCAYTRFYLLNWPKQRAITEPINDSHKWPKFKDIAEKNGISQSTFNHRIQRGWPPKMAASSPKGARLKGRKSPIVNKKYYELAEKNGIKRSTFDSRLLKGWSFYKAATEPIKTQYRRKL